MVYIPWSKARYSISIGGKPVDDRIAPYLLTVQVTDKEGETSDAATIVLSDFIPGSSPPMPAFELPPKGTPVSISLGSDGRGIAQVFEGFVETARSKGDRGGGRTIEIQCQSMDSTSDAKSPKQKHKDGGTLGAAAKEFGQAGAINITVHPDLASIERPYWAMDDESPIGWARRAALEHGGVFKIQGSNGVIVPKGAGLSASGKPVTPISVVRGENLIAWDLAPDSGRPPYQKVTARYYDPKQAKYVQKEVEVDSGAGSGTTNTKQSVRFTRADEGEADKAGAAEATDQKHEKGGGTVDIDGEPSAVAGAPCTVQGCHPQVDIIWIVASVTHELSRQRGFVTKLELAMPGASGSGSKGDAQS